MNLFKWITALSFVLLICCTKETVETVTNSTFAVESAAFTNNGTLPAKYTCDGLSYSPPISWKNIPSNTKSFAVTMHHIPGPGEKHVYMVVYNIPSTTSSLLENSTNIGLFGINTVNGKTIYTPPCSQGPGAKLYTLTVYALSTEPVFGVAQSKVTMDILLSAITNTTLGTAAINVNYSRP
jgi:phosphatidylethanolamine-binding protein (PEBP) family uncharacterized protein